MRSRLLVFSMVALAVVSAALATWLILHLPEEAAGLRQGGSKAGGQSGEVLIGGPFTALDHHGERVTEASFLGQVTIFYFGYTFCPDVCPLGLSNITAALELLPASVQERIRPLFVTVDPERDTVAVMADYVQAFHPRLVGITGTVEEIQAITRAWRVYAKKSEVRAPADYLVDHSTFIYVMGPDGRYLTHFGHGATPEEMAAKLQALVATS